MKQLLTSLHEFDPMLWAAERVLIAADFDGTLCPIAASPSSVVVDPTMMTVLQTLQACERVTVAVISGRPIHEMRARLPFVTAFAGNHGLEIETAGFHFVHPQAEAAVPRLEQACCDLERVATKWNGAWIERKRLSATLHYRQVESCAQPALLWTARRTLSAFGREFSLRGGKFALEIRPRVDWDKGCAVNAIREHYSADLVICLGDDRTDESMFLANAGGPNVYVGSSDRSAAGYRARNPAEVMLLLSHICHAGFASYAERVTA